MTDMYYTYIYYVQREFGMKHNNIKELSSINIFYQSSIYVSVYFIIVCVCIQSPMFILLLYVSSRLFP